MTPAVLRSWQAYCRPLSTVGLHALLRGLRNCDPALGDPILYAVQADGLTAEEVTRRLCDIMWQVDRELANDFNSVTEFGLWWLGTPHGERCMVLAVEVGLELERRERAGATESVRLC